MKFIAARLTIRGWVNRGDLVVEFGISIQQASHDIRTFLKLYPKAMRYNLSSKRYERKEPLPEV